MKIYVDEMPESCRDCLCFIERRDIDFHGFICGAGLGLYAIQHASGILQDCPLELLSESKKFTKLKKIAKDWVDEHEKELNRANAEKRRADIAERALFNVCSYDFHKYDYKRELQEAAKEVKKMREILFRGKRLDNGQWMEGFYASAAGMTFMSGFAAIEPVRIDHETVGLFTGLHDKNGKKIFEGDIESKWEHEAMEYSECGNRDGEVCYATGQVCCESDCPVEDEQ